MDRTHIRISEHATVWVDDEGCNAVLDVHDFHTNEYWQLTNTTPTCSHAKPKAKTKTETR